MPITTEISKTHRRIIAETVSINPSSSLEQIASLLNGMSSMMTCSVKITTELLKELGFKEPDRTANTAGNNGSSATPRLTSQSIRQELEERHSLFQRRILSILKSEANTAAELKALQSLSVADKESLNMLFELMNDEGAPVFPQAIIVACLRQLGVPEEQIAFVERT